MPSTIRRVAAAVSAMVSVAALASTSIAVATAPPATAAASNTLTVKASEYKFEVSGAPKSGWTEVTFDNTGKQFHMLAAVPLKAGVTLAQAKKAALSKNGQAALSKLSTGGFAVGIPFIAGPSGSSTTIAQLDAGHYVMLCFFSAPDGKPHLAHGMIGEFTVSKAKSGLTPPTDGVVDVTTSDTAITLPDGTLPATGWAKVSTTVTDDPRDFTVAKYSNDATTFEQANAYVDEYIGSGKAPAGEPLVTIVGNVGSFTAGPVSYLKLDLQPGRYVAVSDTDSDQDQSKQLHQDFTVS